MEPKYNGDGERASVQRYSTSGVSVDDAMDAQLGEAERVVHRVAQEEGRWWPPQPQRWRWRCAPYQTDDTPDELQARTASLQLCVQPRARQPPTVAGGRVCTWSTQERGRDRTQHDRAPRLVGAAIPHTAAAPAAPAPAGDRRPRRAGAAGHPHAGHGGGHGPPSVFQAVQELRDVGCWACTNTRPAGGRGCPPEQLAAHAGRPAAPARPCPPAPPVRWCRPPWACCGAVRPPPPRRAPPAPVRGAAPAPAQPARHQLRPVLAVWEAWRQRQQRPGAAGWAPPRAGWWPARCVRPPLSSCSCWCGTPTRPTSHSPASGVAGWPACHLPGPGQPAAGQQAGPPPATGAGMAGRAAGHRHAGRRHHAGAAGGTGARPGHVAGPATFFGGPAAAQRAHRPCGHHQHQPRRCCAPQQTVPPAAGAVRAAGRRWRAHQRAGRGGAQVHRPDQRAARGRRRHCAAGARSRRK